MCARPIARFIYAIAGVAIFILIVMEIFALCVRPYCMQPRSGPVILSRPGATTGNVVEKV